MRMLHKAVDANLKDEPAFPRPMSFGEAVNGNFAPPTFARITPRTSAAVSRASSMTSTSRQSVMTDISEASRASRVKTPTGWLSVHRQLGFTCADSSSEEEDDDEEDDDPSSERDEEEEEEEADLGEPEMTPMVGSRNSVAAMIDKFNSPSSDVLDDGGGTGGEIADHKIEEEIRQRFDVALQQEPCDSLSFLFRFESEREKAFWDHCASRSLHQRNVAILGCALAGGTLALASTAESCQFSLPAAAVFLASGWAPRLVRRISLRATLLLTTAQFTCGCLLAILGFNSPLSLLVSWSWILCGLTLKLPFALTLPGCLVSSALVWWRGNPSLTFAPACLAVLQWADERVQRRRHMVREFQQATQGRMQAVAENLMPPSVVHELRCARFGRRMTALPWHEYDLLTAMHADLVGFTAFSRTKEPEEVVCVINGLFSIFDRCVDARKIYKMETIGDAYVCASGLADYNEGRHSATDMLLLAHELVHAVEGYREKTSADLGIRVGIHTGPCVGGVVGTTMQRYHLFGRTMQLAEVLESTAPKNRLHISERTKRCLEEESFGESDGPWFEARKQPLVTSKGETVTALDVDGLETFLALFPGEQCQSEGCLEERRDSLCGESAIQQMDAAVAWHRSLTRSTQSSRTKSLADAGLISCDWILESPGTCRHRTDLLTRQSFMMTG